MHAQSQAVLNSDINVTPLVDVCLVLLIIFMVVTPLMVTNVPVNLPGAGSADPLARQPLQITLQADGTLFIGDQILRVEQLTSALETHAADRQRPVVVQADKSLPYGKVVEVLDACRLGGFTSVGLAAQKLER